MVIDVKIVGANQIRDKLARLGSELYNFTEEFAAIGTELTAYYAGSFSMKGSQYGKPWAPLRPATLAYKTNHMGDMMGGASPSQPLIFSGKMRDSFKFEAGPTALRVYNAADYFKYHQLGTSPGRGRGHNIPQRVMMALNGQLIEGIKTTIKTGLRARIEAA
jgi:phage gpG-like protein